MNLTGAVQNAIKGNMPRQPRLDAPGTLHHVMGRWIETSKIFRNRKTGRTSSIGWRNCSGPAVRPFMPGR
jgi:hypothetical protein